MVLGLRPNASLYLRSIGSFEPRPTSEPDRAHALAEMDDLKGMSLHGHVLPFNLALVYIGLGDRERALDCLEQAYGSDSQWMGWVKQDRIFDPLRTEPRFVALMKKLGFDS